MVTIKSGGYFLDLEVAPVVDVAYEERRQGGCWSLTWSMPDAVGLNHPALNPTSVVELYMGARRSFRGTLLEPDGSGSFSAEGLCRQAESYLARNGTATTSTPDVAVSGAVGRGMPWTFDGFSAVPIKAGDATIGLNSVATVLNTAATELGLAWGVDEDSRFYSTGVPTEPTWAAIPGSVKVGVTEEEYATDLCVAYIADVGGFARVDVSAPGPWGRREYPVDLTPLGAMTAERATAIGNQMLADAGPRAGFTDSIELLTGQLTTVGGEPAALDLIRANDLIRVFNITGPAAQLLGGPGSTLDVVVDVVKHTPGSGSITLDPLGKTDRTLSEILSVDDGDTRFST